MKRVILIHGWGGFPDNHWFPWLKQELASRGFQVIVPEMPNNEEPEIEAWVAKLSEAIGEPDDDTYLIGHSIGCQTIMRFLEKIDKRIGGVIFVAGFFNLIPSCLRTEEAKIIAKPWLKTIINTERVKNNAKEFIAIFSDNDNAIPLTDKELFEKRLNAKTIVEHNKGHFTTKSGVLKLPIVLKELLRISSQKQTLYP